MRREVVRVVSPGTLTDANYLDAREPAFLMAIVYVRRRQRPGSSSHGFGAALLDLSTGEFTTAEYHGDDGRQALADEIAVLRPREIVCPVDSHVADALPDLARLQMPVTTPTPGASSPLALATRCSTS